MSTLATLLRTITGLGAGVPARPAHALMRAPVLQGFMLRGALVAGTVPENPENVVPEKIVPKNAVAEAAESAPQSDPQQSTSAARRAAATPPMRRSAAAPASGTPTPGSCTSKAPGMADLTKVSIPCPDPTLEDRTRDAHQNRALQMARQEDWTALSAMIAQADRSRATTPGGMSVAELMAFGARADVVLAVEHALIDRTPERDAPLLRGIEALEFVLAEHPGDPVIGCIVAQAHMDMAWAWRGIGWDVDMAPRNREAFDAHFARAHDIVGAFRGLRGSSTLLSATSCALLRGNTGTAHAVADRYAALIDLNPATPSPLRALGTHMLPRWYGSYAGLELEARRTAARTEDLWGAGGYTWVMFDAVSVDDVACAHLDLDFFIEGLHDIAARRPEPHTINLLAAYCASTMGQTRSGTAAADKNRARIAACADWLVRDHLTELHPMVWAHAAQGFVNNLRVSSPSRFAASGKQTALQLLTEIFRAEIDDGQKITFTRSGATAGPL